MSLATALSGGVTINAAAFTEAQAALGEGAGNNNMLIGGGGSDYILGGSGTGNTLVGNGRANNQLIGGSGSSDSIEGGGAGSENLLVGSSGGGDVITGGKAGHVYTPGNNDTVNVQAGNAIVYAAGAGEVVNTGGSSSDHVLHPGACRNGRIRLHSVAGGGPWFFAQLPSLADLGSVSTLPNGPDSQGQWIQYAESASDGGVSNSGGAAI